MKKQITDIDLEGLTIEGETRVIKWCMKKKITMLMNIGDLLEYLFEHNIQDTVKFTDNEVTSEKMCDIFWIAVRNHLNFK